MKIAVTGASGHIGNVVCRMLLEQKHEVKAFYNRDKRALIGLSLELIQGDILNKKDLEKLVRGCDIVFHCAAIISINGDPEGKVFRTNTEGAQNILDASIKAGVKKIIHVSSTHAVQEEPQHKPLTEDRAYKTSANYAYDYSKAQGEQIILAAIKQGKIKGCVVRPSAVVGPFDFKPSELGKALIDFRNRKVPVLPPGGYNFVDVRDVALAMINAIENVKNGAIYNLTGKYFSMKDFAQKINETTGVKVPKAALPFWFMKLILPFIILQERLTNAAPVFTIESITTLKNGHKNIDNSKAKKDLHLNPRPIRETFKDYYNWVDNRIEQ